ncbi:hypothetical protein VTK73DRAFT_377 [Phialemonium thermophilum]|uniref:Xylanolytic transcriptional activator regulatory domain-containing protein n=1 Tax=Phialemonium thermophilum TaxID=223376 RepID=A0ABR3VVK1_9PEZI
MASSGIRFVGTDDRGLPVKRKQIQEACGRCRSRKKRCTHKSGDPPPYNLHRPSGDQVTPAKASPLSQECLGADARPLQRPHHLREERSAQAASSLVKLSSRFIGDLNPESIFVQAATDNQGQAQPIYRDSADIGTWLSVDCEDFDERDPPACIHESPCTSRPRQPRVMPSIMLVGQSSPGRQTKHNHHLSACLKVAPPDEDFAALRAIYVERIHPMLPVLNISDVGEQAPSPSTVSRIMFKQVISLSVAAESRAAPHLRLEPGGPRLHFHEFHRRLAQAIFQILDAHILPSRVDHIRVLVMLSLFYQPSSSSERDQPSLFSSLAVHHAQSLGIHIRGYRTQRPDENVEQLFCAVWALDRLTAAANGKSCAIHERDVDRDLNDCIAKQPACFRLFLRVIQYLDLVIDLYRPRSASGPVDMPVFETLVLDSGAEKVPSALLGTIEILYHAICVLSVRRTPSLSTALPPSRERAHLLDHSFNTLRSLSADRIVQVVRAEDISMMPWIPYAVSVSLSVSYRKMRYTLIPMYRARARNAFRDTVSLLEKLGRVYWSARVNAQLGDSILREMERTANHLTEVPDGRRCGDRTTLDQEADRGAESSSKTSKTPSGRETPTMPASSTAGRDAMGDSEGIHLMGAGSASLDAAVMGELEDVDLFGYFDPEFNLDAVDAALEANLDMSYPQNWNAPWYGVNGEVEAMDKCFS